VAEVVELRSADLDACVLGLPVSVTSVLRDHPAELVVAGGFVRAVAAGESVSDVDVFATSRELAQEAAREMIRLEGERVRHHDSRRAYNVVPEGMAPVQFAWGWSFDHPGDLISSFDFTVAMAALWWERGEWRGVADPRFYPHLEERRLHYVGREGDDPRAELLRVLRYVRKGYRVEISSLGALVAQIILLPGPSTLSLDRLGQQQADLFRSADTSSDPAGGEAWLRWDRG